MKAWGWPGSVDNIERHLLHHTQQKMRRRINTLLEMIEKSGSEGVERRKLEEVMLVNGISAPPKTREYLSYLESFGKVVQEDGRYYLSSVKTVQTSMDSLESYTYDTHTNRSEG